MTNTQKTLTKLFLTGLASVPPLLGLTTQAQNTITNGLVAYWNFNGQNFKDSVGHFDGTANGTDPIAFAAGKFGQAMQLNGVDQMVEITGATDPDELAFPGGSISIAGWFTVGTFDKQWQALIAKGEGSNWRVHRRAGGTGLSYAGGIGEGADDAPDVTDGAWHHFVAVSDPGAVNFGTALYIDGQIHSINVTAPNLVTNGKNVMIGENPDARNRYWNGLVDDLAIWNRVLTEAEISSLYATGTGKEIASFFGPPVFSIAAPIGTFAGFTIAVSDAPPVVADTNTIVLKFNGAPVTPTSVTKNNGITTIAYNVPNPPLPSKSTNTTSLTIKDSTGADHSSNGSFVVAPYITVPPSLALTGVDTTKPGFNVRPHQIDTTRGPGGENSLANAEQQAADGYIDPLTGLPYANTADLTGATGGIIAYTGVINWNNNGTAYGILNVPADIGNWRDTNAAPYNLADIQFPGMPGSANANHNSALDAAFNSFVEEISVYLQLPTGYYRMGVNSDDGFKVSVAPGTPDVFGLQLGVFDGTRGSANTLFDFYVPAGGYFPFRLLWWNGNGGASLEWFIVDTSTGQRYLINQNDPKAPKAFRTAAGPASVKSILPANGFAGVNTNSPVKIVLVDGSTTVVDGSISLWIDGNQVSPTIVNGATTTVTYNGTYKFVTSHTGTLVWGESTTPQTMHTNNFTFAIRQQTPDDLPSYTAGSFWIEAEDFDSTGTPVPAAVNTMPYDIGAAGFGPYEGVGATLNVDYFNNDNQDNSTPAGTATVYRSAGDTATNGRSVDLANDPNANFGLRRPGGYDMTANYKIGWGDNADWYNYTRKIPAGLYTAVIALSNGGAAAGTPDRMGGTLSIVTSGVGTTNQVLKQVGTFNGPSSGAWSFNNLVPLYAPDGSQAAFKITTATTTLRYANREGDFDWFALIPVSGVAPKVTSASPLANTATGAFSDVPRNAKLRLTIEDFSTAVVQNTVKLFFDSNDVTASATITKPADITTITFDPGLLAGGSTHSYELRFTDNGSPAVSQTNKATFTVSAALGTPGQFLIEAEDFNHDSGQAVALASTMPYTGNGYNGLGAVFDVDYHSTETLTAADGWTPVYRSGAPITTNTTAPLNDNLGGNLGRVRSDGWQMTVDFKIGWTGTGDWYNYTRNIGPTNNYQIYAALSHGDAPSANATGLRGAIDLVSAASTNRLGVFQAPATGGWGLNALIPMQGPTTNGVPETVSLGGQQTLRFYTDSGDFDYFLLVPATAQIRVNSIAITGGQVTIQWSGGGTIEWTTSLTPPVNWTPTTDSDGSYSEPVATAGNKYYRVKQP
jgi:hypothetical protein